MQALNTASKADTISERTSALAKLLQVDSDQAQQMCERFPRLVQVTPAYMRDNFNAIAQEFKFSSKALRKVARRSPDILLSTAKTQSENAASLRELFGFSAKQINSIFRQAPTIFGLSPISLYNGAIEKCSILGIELAAFSGMCLRRPSLIYQSSPLCARQFASLQHCLGLDQDRCRNLVVYAPELLTRKVDLLERRLRLIADALAIEFPQVVKLIFVSRAIASQRAQVLIDNMHNLAARLGVTPQSAIEMCVKEPRLMSRDPEAIGANFEMIKLVRGDSDDKSLHAIMTSPNHLLLAPERSLAHFFIRELTGWRPVISLNPYTALSHYDVEIDSETLIPKFRASCERLGRAGVVRPELVGARSLELMGVMLEQVRSCVPIGALELAEVLQAVALENCKTRKSFQRTRSAASAITGGAEIARLNTSPSSGVSLDFSAK